MSLNNPYAGIFKRFVATLIDGIILIFLQVIPFGFPPKEYNNVQDIMHGLFSLVFSWLYFSMMESSSLQATFGKKLLEICVTNKNGQRISFAQASVRYFGKAIWLVVLFVGIFIGVLGQSTGAEDSPYFIITALLALISFLILVIGYSMAWFTPEKQALHDIIARCLVVNDQGQNRKINWTPLAVLLVVSTLVGRIVLSQLPTTNFVSENSGVNSASAPQETTSVAPTSSPVRTPETTDSIAPQETINIPTKVMAFLEGVTLDDIKVSNFDAPRTYKLCGKPLLILNPGSNDNITGDFKLEWATRGDTYVGRLKMQDQSGKMRIVTLEAGNLKVVDQTMQLYKSAKGYILLGFNPINVETQQQDKTYSADNLIMRRELDQTVTIINCDDSGESSPVIFESFTSNQGTTN
ncbi:RDD family protein [Calothrix sp. PCC 6303]|uniref:RDD family protein n=1 Tax=Calothrix sp. PCC 6303 TaxID=1170562 RepID=UPI0002A03543|nr:RDD family protein [Calothrix sp. PCC 6303]AFY99797.1 RDD domain containing protein [Calothrix sp. PCC 6303]